MTDRIRHLTVVLEHDTRDDDVDALVQAIRQMRNVATVETNVADINVYLARQTAKHELRRDLAVAINEILYDAK